MLLLDAELLVVSLLFVEAVGDVLLVELFQNLLDALSR